MQTPELSTEQEALLKSVYQYTDKADFSDAEIEAAKEMFDSPEKFVILRKIFGVITEEERGINYQGKLATLSANDFQQMGIEASIQKAVEARIQRGLAQFYSLLKGELKVEMKAKMEKDNIEKMQEADSREARVERDQEANRVGGPNL